MSESKKAMEAHLVSGSKPTYNSVNNVDNVNGKGSPFDKKMGPPPFFTENGEPPDPDKARKDKACFDFFDVLKRGEKREKVKAMEMFKFATYTDKVLIAFGVCGSIISGVCFIGNVFILGEVINLFLEDDENGVTQTNYEETLLPYIYSYIGVGCVAIVSGFTNITCWTLSAEHQVSTMRKKFFTSVMKQDIGWFDLHDSGEISARFSEDLTKIQEGIGDKFGIFLQWVATWFAAIIMAFTRSWILTLFAVPFSPLMIILGMLFFKNMRKMAMREGLAYAKAGGIAEQAFRAIRTVQAFQGQEKECARYEKNLTPALQLASKKGLVLGLATSSTWVINYTLFACVMWFGTWLVFNENLEAGSIIPVFFGILIGSMALTQAFTNLESLSNARGAAVKVFQTIALESAIDPFSEEGLKPRSFEGHIEFRNVNFVYPARPEVTVAKDLTFTIKPGQHIALVGQSGCGKSTAIQLLQRFYDPQDGEITIDGNNIKDLNVQWLREQIGVVSQEPVLFDASIEENIRLGHPEATLEDIIEVAKMANAHNFIKSLPEGYKTNVGERGAQLSGGQKQRISIARALVRNPRILLMDEATSALDHESEALVQAALDKAGKGRTTITIAHRLSTVKHADKILAIENGKVIEEGPHDDLLLKKGLYFQLVQIQSKIDIETEKARQSEPPKSPDVVEFPTHPLEEQKPRSSSLLGKLKRSLSNYGNPTPDPNPLSRANSTLSMNAEEEEIDEHPEMNVSLWEILQYNAPEWKLIVPGCCASVIAGCVPPCFSFIMSEFIKVFTYNTEAETQAEVNILAGAILGVAVVIACARVTQEYCISNSGAALTARLRRLTFASIINQDMEYFDHPDNQVGAITARLSGDAAHVQGATGSKIGQVLEGMATIITALTIAFVFGWQLALVVISFLPLMVGAGIIQGKVMSGSALKEKIQLQIATKICSESVDNIRTVASLGREDFFVRKFEAMIDENSCSAWKKCMVYGIAYAVANSMLFFAYATSFYYGGILIDDGTLEFYNVFRVFAAIIFGGIVVGRNSSFGVDYVKARMAAGRIVNLINRKPKIDVRDETGEKLLSVKGAVSLENAEFHYVSRPNIKVLDGLDLPIKPGQTVALVGQSGCGKSTTAQLLQRFYDLDSGTVTLDGRDIRTLNLRWFRQQIGVVSQEPTLFDCSIADNIAYGDNSRQVPMSDIIAAAKGANIHNFISALPKGYDTFVGEKGTQLSGGQKQRVAIARALVRNPRILILDEATSALDTESERIVQEALDRASENRTCVTIAHRLSTVQKADKIAVFSSGKVVETGNHKDLMASKGAYYRLQKAQDKPDHH